jgi:hypothetical protein
MRNRAVPAVTTKSLNLRADDKTLKRLTQLGELQCTPDEVALIFGVAEAAMAKFLARSRLARAAFAGGRGHGLEAQRRAQFKLAETNATMAIFLGKNYLGQADRRELEQSGAIDLSHAGQRVRDKLAAIAAEPAAEGDRQGERATG